MQVKKSKKFLPPLKKNAATSPDLISLNDNADIIVSPSKIFDDVLTCGKKIVKEKKVKKTNVIKIPCA